MTITMAQALAAKAKVLSLVLAQDVPAAVGLAKVGEDYAVSITSTDPLPEWVPTEVDGVQVVAKIAGPVIAY